MINHVDPKQFWGQTPRTADGGDVSDKQRGTALAATGLQGWGGGGGARDVLLPGDKLPLTSDKTAGIQKLLENQQWPVSRRAAVAGHGTCLGITAGPNGAYIGKQTTKNADLIKTINAAIRSATDDTDFRWGSIQINHNTVAEIHTDS